MINKPPEIRTKKLQHLLNPLPKTSGIYLMKDSTGKIIYVGKARNLYNRVNSYFNSTLSKEPKIRVMTSKVSDFDYIVTETESEALILENLMIKKHKPAYNSRLKDDKTYPYIKIDPAESFPQLYFTRRVKPDGARYFGPFASALSVRRTMDLLKKLFPYRSCTKVITGTDERACLEFHINRCVAPCIGAVNETQYHEVINQMIRFLEGDSDNVLHSLQSQMTEASREMRFEQAAILRDQIKAIKSVSENQKVVSEKKTDCDAIAIAIDRNDASAELFQIRHGKISGREHFLMEGVELEDSSLVIERFIHQYYESTTSIPSELLIEHELEYRIAIENWLSGKRGSRVKILTPQRGEKFNLVRMVSENARQGLEHRRLKWLGESDKVLRALNEISEALSLAEIPNRIECYDISNIQGTNSVGSMVVFERGRPKPSQYRRFMIKDVEGPDDYASMQEMLHRRFKRLGLPITATTKVNETGSSDFGKTRRANPNPENISIDDSWKNVPDLVLIDGGKGHLNAVQEVFLELGITEIPLASIAKQREEIFLPHMPEPLFLDRNSQGLYLMQRIRDEAHRFAITYHRNRRSKASTKSDLDMIPGIGPKRKKLLLRKFGNLTKLRNASVEEVAELQGFTTASSRTLLELLGGFPENT